MSKSFGIVIIMWKSKKEAEKDEIWLIMGILLLISIISFLSLAILDLNVRLDGIENPDIVEVHNYLKADDFEEFCRIWDVEESMNISIDDGLIIEIGDVDLSCDWICSSNTCNLYCNSELIAGIVAEFIDVPICNQTILVKKR